QLAHTIHYVNHAREEREKSSANHDVKQGKKAELQHHPCDRDHLADCRNFTRPPWSHLHFAVEQIENGGADENDGVARDNQNGEPCRESTVIGIDVAPITDAQCNDTAEQQAFVRNGVENNSKRAPLVVATGDISV